MPNNIVDFRFCKKLVAYEWRRRPAPTNTPLLSRAAVYVRMSTEHQQYSPDNQLDVIRQYAASHGMEIVQVYSDHGSDYPYCRATASEIGTWKIHLSRLQDRLVGSKTWVKFDGTSVTRKVWDGRANLEEFETDSSTGSH